MLHVLGECWVRPGSQEVQEGKKGKGHIEEDPEGHAKGADFTSWNHCFLNRGSQSLLGCLLKNNRFPGPITDLIKRTA